MIVQAIGLLDELDKEVNNYIMRCREWYGWHFPELGKILTDNLEYVKTIKTLGNLNCCIIFICVTFIASKEFFRKLLVYNCNF